MASSETKWLEGRPKKETRRWRRYLLHAETLAEALRGGAVAQWPEGASIRRIGWCFERDSLGIIVEHPSFAPVADGEEIPLAGPVMFLLDRERLEAVRVLLVEGRLHGDGR